MIPTSLLTLGVLADGARLIEAAIVASVNNPNVPALLTAAGWNGRAAEIVLTIDSGVKIGSANAATPAMVLPAFPAGSVVTLVNNGKIMGAGGNGAAGTPVGGTAQPGQTGGTALRVQSPITIQNAGQIYGGGGGGGSGGWVTWRRHHSPMFGWFPAGSAAGTPGGGGAGIVPGSGQNRVPPTEFAGGNPYGAYYSGEPFSFGGGPGAPGVAGRDGGDGPNDTGGVPGAAGGAAGFYIVGHSFVTWSATGSRLGRFG